MDFVDCFNPTEDELKVWAYEEGACYPDDCEQDWDLCISDIQSLDLFIELANDVDCPQRKFFLSCLYIIVGDLYRADQGKRKLGPIIQLIEVLQVDLNNDLLQWKKRSLTLLNYKMKFKYSLWCDGGFAYRYPVDDE